jgi:hypothetical protein
LTPVYQNNPYFPDLPLDSGSEPDITHNRSAVTFAGREVQLTWDAPGKTTGWNDSYTTATFATDAPKWVAWISQLNTTYTPLTNVSGNSGVTLQPGGGVYGPGTAPTMNGTV